MKFSTNEDIAAPIDAVFEKVSDFAGLERQAIRHGAEFERIGDHENPAEGMGWNGQFAFRGKQRNVIAHLSRFEQPTAYTVISSSSGLNGEVKVECIALSPAKTRLSVQVELRPQTIPARVLVQSLKLAKTTLTKRFKRRVADFASTIERRSA